MKKNLLVSLTLGGLLVSAIFTSQSMAAVFHVTNATEFQAALDAAETNGEDDTIYLAAGTYRGFFIYQPPGTEHKSLTITGAPGTSSETVILERQGTGSTGGLYLYDVSSGPVVGNIVINGITAQNTGRQGIDVNMYPYNISITNCIIRDNTGIRFGGGLKVWTHGNVILENNFILNNTASEDNGQTCGGGAYMRTNNGSCILRNNIIAGNSAQGTTDPQGGGLNSDCNTVHLIGNTLYNNQANKGGGVYFAWGTTANVYNNIIYANTATQGGDIYFDTVTNKIGFNNNYSDMSGSWTDSGGNLNTDPLFVDPTNNDLHLHPASPMINAGTSAVPNPPGLPYTDFEGNLRVYGSTPDIGAYEFQGSPIPIFPGEGTIGTEITITGSGEYGPKKGKVSIEKVALTVREWTDQLIRCELLKTLLTGTYDVTIRPSAKGSSPITIEDGFTVKGPEIELIEPTSGSVADTITINGLFFGTKKGKVTLGGKSCKVTVWTMNKTTGESEIQFVVPKGLTSGTKYLKVINGVGSDTVNFTIE